MVEILRNKNLATKFQILVEIASSGPQIQQRDIAGKLDVTPQAISDYIAQLTREGKLISEGRSRYKLTNEGTNWVIKVLRELRSYDTFIEKAVTNISVSTAVADVDLSPGQTVGLEMREGLLVATSQTGEGAKGITTSQAGAGGDVGVSNIEGLVNLKVGKATILVVPGIQRGGSRLVDTDRLKREITGIKFVGGIGIEALVSLKKVTRQPVYAYGVTEAAIEAAKSGISPVVVCVEDDTSGLMRRLDGENIDYSLADLRKPD
ncbi:winged helix-turn-helix transcriptional regulator [Chloroflexota bacterium]